MFLTPAAVLLPHSWGRVAMLCLPYWHVLYAGSFPVSDLFHKRVKWN